MLKIILNEEILNQIQEDYPQSWDFEKFKSLNTFRERIEYAQNNLKRLSSGSSRIVYQIDDEKVLKLAKNKKGLAQNELEINTANDYIAQAEGIFAPIYGYDEENFQWVEMALARKFNRSAAKKFLGMEWGNYIDFLTWTAEHYRRGGRPMQIHGQEFNDKMVDILDDYEYDFINSLYNYMLNSQVIVGDLVKPSTYGIIKVDGEDYLHIVDYGFNDQIAKDHYNA